jgi:antirestriction protein ArdC
MSSMLPWSRPWSGLLINARLTNPDF